MKKLSSILLVLFIMAGAMSALFYYSWNKNRTMEKRKITIETTFDEGNKHGYMFVGSPEEISKQKEMNELVDPVVDIVMNADDQYKKGNYGEAEKEALKALKLAKHGIVKHMAHNILMKTYETTKNYKSAILEIDWLLQHVNEYAKPDLLKKRAELEKLLNK